MGRRKDEPEHVCQTFTRKGDFAVCVECGQWVFLG